MSVKVCHLTFWGGTCFFMTSEENTHFLLIQFIEMRYQQWQTFQERTESK